MGHKFVIRFLFLSSATLDQRLQKIPRSPTAFFFFFVGSARITRIVRQRMLIPTLTQLAIKQSPLCSTSHHKRLRVPVVLCLDSQRHRSVNLKPNNLRRRFLRILLKTNCWIAKSIGDCCIRSTRTTANKPYVSRFGISMMTNFPV